MLLLMWWIWAYRQLAALGNLPEGQSWPTAVIVERTAEERFTFRLLIAALCVAAVVGIIYVVVASNVEGAHAALRQCESLLGAGALVETTNCIIQSAETLARAGETALWVSGIFWVVVVV